MRIAVWHNLHSGGASRALQYHIQGLVAKGHEVEVWANDPNADGFIKFPASVILHKIALFQTEKQPSLKERLGSLFFHQDENMRAMVEHSQKCASEIKEGNFDVLFAHSCYLYATPFIGRYIDIPKVLYLHEPNRYLYEAMPKQIWTAPEELLNKMNPKFWLYFFSDLWRTHKLRVYVREERTNFQTFDKVLVNSYFSMESCKRAYGLNSEVCYLGIDTTIFKPVESKPEQPYVIGLGGFMKHKNQELAIRAIAEIKGLRPKLLWVGNLVDEEHYEEMAILANSLNVTLELKRMVSDEYLVELLSGAICMIYSSNLEPFGLAPLEANACGTPVVGIAEGGVRETIIHGKSGFLANPNPVEIAGYIQQLIENHEFKTEMARFSIENVQQKWTLAQCTERINKAIQSVIL